MRALNRSSGLLVAAAVALSAPRLAQAQTVITFTRADILYMANTFMVGDSRTLSAMAKEQYPSRAGWTTPYNFFQNPTYTAADGDLHVDLALDASGTGAFDTCCGTGDSPITGEILNATGNSPKSDAMHLKSLDTTLTYWDGVFRFRTEHSCSSCFDLGERKFEIHPATKVYKSLDGGSTYVLDHDYGDAAHLKTVKDGMTHTIADLEFVFTDTWSATVEGDTTKVDFTFPSVALNYAEFKGVVTVASAKNTSGAGEYYFTFHPTDGVVSTRGQTKPMNPPVPSSLDPIVRVVPGSLAESELLALGPAGLTVGSVLNVNSLTREDWADIQNQVSPLTTAGASTGTRPLKVELIALDLKNITVAP